MRSRPIFGNMTTASTLLSREAENVDVRVIIELCLNSKGNSYTRMKKNREKTRRYRFECFKNYIKYCKYYILVIAAHSEGAKDFNNGLS